MMKSIAVMGAGAVGCYYGGMLARAGHSVSLIGRALHVEAVQREGLLLDTASFKESVPMFASTDARAAQGAELVLFCVKSVDTESAGRLLAPHLAPGALVLSLQNGVENVERLQSLLPMAATTAQQHQQQRQEVAPAVVYVGAEMAGPGHVKHHGRGELLIGWPSTRSADAVAALFTNAGVPVQIVDNITGALWAKLILNCAYNAISAIAKLPYGRLVEVDGVQAVMQDVVGECIAVAQAEGVTLPDDVWDTVQGLARTMPAQFSSTAQDLARGRPSEIDHLNGVVLRKGEARGIATPVNRVLCTLVKLLEAHEVQVGVVR